MGHNEKLCHGTVTRRDDLLRKVDCWVSWVECALARQQEAACRPARPLGQPLISHTPTQEERRTADMNRMKDLVDSRVTMTLVNNRDPDLELKNRLRTNIVVGGYPRYLYRCFMKNGMDPEEYCPTNSDGQPLCNLREVAAEYDRQDAMKDLGYQSSFRPRIDLSYCCCLRGPPRDPTKQSCYTYQICDKKEVKKGPPHYYTKCKREQRKIIPDNCIRKEVKKDPPYCYTKCERKEVKKDPPYCYTEYEREPRKIIPENCIRKEVKKDTPYCYTECERDQMKKIRYCLQELEKCIRKEVKKDPYCYIPCKREKIIPDNCQEARKCIRKEVKKDLYCYIPYKREQVETVDDLQELEKCIRELLPGLCKTISNTQQCD